MPVRATVLPRMKGVAGKVNKVDRAAAKVLQFYRDFRLPQGGDRKVRDYFGYASETPGWRTRIAFSDQTGWKDNPWVDPGRWETGWEPAHSDGLFLAGRDWEQLSVAERRSPPVPVINLVQHVRHASHPQLSTYLSYPAIRLCVSRQVADAVVSTGRVRGPVLTIAAATDVLEEPLPRPAWSERRFDVFIGGSKNPVLANTLHEALAAQGLRVRSVREQVPRSAFLEGVGDSRVALFLPHATEGFYLPALEAMALETLVVCPDCVGNRDFCRAGASCEMPAYDYEPLLDAVHHALRLPPAERARRLRVGQDLAREHSRSAEADAFRAVLTNLDQLWSEATQRRQPTGATLRAPSVRFLGIGAQKSGTSWLYEQLRCHPSLRFPAGKEVHFWDQHRTHGLAWYAQLFPDNDGAANGEITPAYAILPEHRIAEIAAVLPEVRLIYLIRNPIERAWSSALMALRRAEMRVSEASDAWFIDHFLSEGSLLRGDYELCLKRWFKYFSPDRILIERFERVHQAPRELLVCCAEHLGVDPEPFQGISDDALAARVHAGPDWPLRPSLWPALRELYGPRIERLSALLGEDFSDWLDPFSR